MSRLMPGAGLVGFLLVGAPFQMEAQPARACPKAKGELLCVTFTGVMVFHETSTKPLRYVVNIPELGAHEDSHEPYIRYKVDDKDGEPKGFRVSEEMPCQGYPSKAQYVRLTGQRLTIDSSNADIGDLERPKPLYLAPLGDLSRKADPTATFSDACIKMPTPPTEDPMAGCVALDHGVLSPIFVTETEWAFKTPHGWHNSGYQSCVADAVVLALPLKPGTKTISIQGTAPYDSELRLKVHTDHPTEILVGNTMKKDIFCPNEMTKEETDKHFSHQYSLVRGKTTEYIPHRTKKPCSQVSSADALRGSNCLGGQWP